MHVASLGVALLSFASRCSLPNNYWSVSSSNWSVPNKKWSVPRKNWSHKTMILVTKRVAVAPFELKLNPHGSYRRHASFQTTPGAQKAHI